MFNRRSFLLATGTGILGQFLSGCNAQNTDLRVLVLEKSIPPQLIGAFRRSLVQNRELSFKPQPQLKDCFSLLQRWQNKEPSGENWENWLPWFNKKPSPLADLVTLGDAWLATAISEKLLTPLEIDKLSGWQALPPRWQNLVRRNEQGFKDENGAIWGAPYRWGTTLIAYNEDKFKTLGWTPQDWGDLWHPELRDRISIIDQYREVIGLTLKKLGYSYNTSDLSQIPSLKSALVALNQQIKFYSSEYYLQPLVLGDTWLAVGWSNDILSLISSNPSIKAVIPPSGTAFWTDIWVKPASVTSISDLAQEWINFCWQSKPASEISIFTDAASPIILQEKPEQLPSDIRKNPLLLVNREILEKSEFIEPLEPAIVKQYLDLWKAVRVQVS